MDFRSLQRRVFVYNKLRDWEVVRKNESILEIIMKHWHFKRWKYLSAQARISWFMSSRTLMTKPAWSHVRATPLSIKPIKMLFCVLNLSPLRLILIKVTHRTTCCSARPKTESSKSGTYKTKYSWTKCSVTIKESLTCIRSILKK